MAPNEHMAPIELEKAIARWTETPGAVGEHRIDPESVPAIALFQSAESLEHIDKMIERLQRRSDAIVQQLEGRREVFASRARRAADKILNAEYVEVPRNEPTETLLAIEPPPQQATQNVPPGDVTIVPASPESEATNTEAMPTEAPTSEPTSGS